MLPAAPVTAVRLLRRAHTVIERRCCDAAFDVRGLASELTISTTRLYAAFEHSPTTPAQAWAWASKVDGANAVLIKGTRGCADLIVSRTAAGGVI